MKHNQNLLVDYDPRWSYSFLEEKKRLAAALGPVAKGIEHYGSTAVPGMRAKPILDILVGVSTIDDWEQCRAPLEALGYDYASDAATPGHFIFGRGRDATERSHLLHIVEFRGPEWTANLALRDALRMDEGLRERYIAEKQRAIAVAPEDPARYNRIKAPFLAKIKAAL